MKKLLVALSIALLPATFLPHNARAQSLAVVDTNIIFEQSEHGKAVIAYFEKIQNEGIKQLESIEEKRKKAEEKKDEKLLQNIESEMQATAYELQTKLQNEQERLFTVISDKLTQTIETYRKDHNIDVILHAAETASYDPKIDVTQKVMKEFNKIKFDIEKELKK